MAFEQNPQINRLLGTNGMGSQQGSLASLQGAPQVSFSPINQNQGGWWDSVKQYLFGSNPQQYSYSPFNQYQQQALHSLLNAGQYDLANPYEGFDLLRDQILRDYQENIIPQIAEQFTAGTGAAASSPQFVKRLQAGGQGLAQKLMAHKLGYGQQNRQFGLQQLQQGLTPQYQTGFVPGQQGLIGSALNRAIPAAASVYGAQQFGGI